MQGKHIVVIEATTTGAGSDLFESAVKLGIHITFMCASYETYRALQLEKYKKTIRIVEVDTTDFPDMLACFNRLKSIDGIICLNDRCIEIAARLAEHYKLPFIPYDAVCACRNKEQTSNICKLLNIPVPQEYILSSKADIAEIEQSLTFPVVLKSSRGTGSGEVTHCYNLKDIYEKYSEIKDKAILSAGIVLVQEYIAGSLVSAEVLIYEGNLLFLGFTDRFIGFPPYFVEYSFTFPSQVSNQVEEKCKRYIRDIAGYLKIEYGVLHVEFIESRNGPILIEVNPRMGGSLLGPAISRAYEIDIYEQIFRLTLKKAPDIPTVTKKSIIFYYLYPQRSGKIKAITGFKEANSFPGIIDIEQQLFAGNNAEVPKDFRTKYVAMIMLESENAASAHLNCINAVNRIKVEYE